MSAVSSGKREAWIVAAERLVCLSTESVACPECGAAKLEVRDREYGISPRRGLERYLFCHHCGCFSAVNLRRAEPSADGRLGEVTV
jgi:hypothetical protein